MFKHKLTISDLLLILVNLVPLYGVWALNWDARIVFLVYCMETVIIGLANVLKMAVVTVFVRPKDNWESNGKITLQSGWFFILFFIMHYGLFVFVQTQLFFGVSGLGKSGSFFGNYSQIPVLLGNEGKMLLLIFLLYYALQTYFDFFANNRFRTISLNRLMFEPYIRIFIQQLVVITGSIFLSFGAGKIFILVFVVVKIGFEVMINYTVLWRKAKERAGTESKN